MGDAITLEVRSPETGGADVLVCVIIPLSPREARPDALLGALPATFEIILARGGTRASSMNAAARAARAHHLWFMHADTALQTGSVDALLKQLQDGTEALRYFDLCFDGGSLMRLTEIGVWFRSRVCGIPFGDQALCLPSQRFHALGGYDESVAVGEDHRLVQQARRAGVPVIPVGATVLTSARKYRENGWFRTTWTHWRLTLHQLHRPRASPASRSDMNRSGLRRSGDDTRSSPPSGDAWPGRQDTD